MANYYTGYLTITTTGPVTLTSIPFQPTYARFSVGKRSNVLENSDARWGQGATDGTAQWAVATLANGSGNWTRNYTDHCIAALTSPSGTITRSFSAIFTSFNSDGITFNVDNCADDFQVYIELFG